tara:strand:+ start:103 stop:1254 length:1152 start_codon:yes stop_codon:yes gene_type:complete
MIQFKNPLTNPRGFFSSQPGGFFAPPQREGFEGFLSDPRLNIGLKIARGEPLGQALFGGAIQAKQLEDVFFPEDEFGTTKQAYNPQTGATVFATEEQIQTQGLTPVPKADTSPEIFQLVGPKGNFIRNVTEEDFLKDADTWEKLGYKLTEIPKGTTAAPSSSEAGQKAFDPFKQRFDAGNQLITGLNNYAKTIVESKDLAALKGAGNFSQFIDGVIKTVDATTDFLKTEKQTDKYGQYLKSATSIEGNNFDQKIANVSQEFGVQRSQIIDLAYQFAAVRGQAGRGLSDRDFQNALDIVSGGVGKEGKLAVISDVANRITNELNAQKQYDIQFLTNMGNEGLLKMYNALPTLQTFNLPNVTDSNDKGVVELIVNPDGSITEVIR